MNRYMNELSTRGFTVVDVPVDTFELILDIVLQDVRSCVNQVRDDLGKSRDISDLMKMSDEEFQIALGSKTQRFILNSAANAFIGWAETTLANIFPGTRASCSVVSPYEVQADRNLRSDSYDFFFRCVRPGSSDIGPAHRDCDFWHASEGTDHLAPIPSWSRSRWKLWMPLSGWDASTALTFIPGSHHENVPVQYAIRAGRPSARIAEDYVLQNESRFVSPLRPAPNHQAVIFHDSLVHRAPANTLSGVRLSCELTMFSSLEEGALLSQPVSE